jgi:hypothetical protein
MYCLGKLEQPVSASDLPSPIASQVLKMWPGQTCPITREAAEDNLQLMLLMIRRQAIKCVYIFT